MTDFRQAPSPYRVAVVGAGPAGAWTARLLARAGIAVIIFDGSHPREKPCGGGLTRRATELVTRELGAFPAVAGVAVRTATFESAAASGDRAPRRDRAAVALATAADDGTPALLVVSRRAFDAALLESARQAGATFVPARVQTVDVGAKGVVITTSAGRWSADLLVGADGPNSLVRRRVAAPFSRGQLSVGAGCYVHGVSGDAIDIRWLPMPPGYLWSFPRPDHLAVGACAQATDLRGSGELKVQVHQWLRDTAIAREHGPRPGARGVRLEPYSWPIPALNAVDLEKHLTVAGERWLLVGDAAGLVDPLTREGIYYALQSAELAATALIADDANPARRYRRDIADRLVPELARAARLKRGFFTPPISQAVVRALNRSRPIRQIMAGLVAGEQPYIGLKRRLAATGRVDLAIDLLLSSWRHDPAASPDT
jgi:geranylgeranyl reductase family protein